MDERPWEDIIGKRPCIMQEIRKFVDRLIKERGKPKNVSYREGRLFFNYGFETAATISNIVDQRAIVVTSGETDTYSYRYSRRDDITHIDTSLNHINIGLLYPGIDNWETLSRIGNRILQKINKILRNMIGEGEIVSPHVIISIEDGIEEFMKRYLSLNYTKFYSWNSRYQGVSRSRITYPIRIGITSTNIYVERIKENNFDFIIRINNKSDEMRFETTFESTYGDTVIRDYISRRIRGYVKDYLDRKFKGVLENMKAE